MGILCDINFRKPTNGGFFTGDKVSGVIRYTLDEDTVITNISISLQGQGCLDVHNMKKKEEADGLIRDEEEYFNENIVVLDDENGRFLPANIYQTKFNFQLPLNAPPTLDFVKSAGSHTVRCRIGYYLRIRFDTPEGNKQFGTTITVKPGVNSELPVEPRIYDKQRKLIQLLRDSFVTLKVTINNPVVSQGGNVNLVYEIYNDTNVNFKSVESKLIEAISVPKGYCETTFSCEDVTDVKTAGVRSGATQTIHVDIPIPKDVYSVENSLLIARDYFVKITVYLPLPYRNVTLKVPLQIIGTEDQNIYQTSWESLTESEDVAVKSDEEL